MYSPICGNIISGDVPENVVITNGSIIAGTFCDDSKIAQVTIDSHGRIASTHQITMNQNDDKIILANISKESYIDGDFIPFETIDSQIGNIEYVDYKINPSDSGMYIISWCVKGNINSELELIESHTDNTPVIISDHSFSDGNIWCGTTSRYIYGNSFIGLKATGNGFVYDDSDAPYCCFQLMKTN